MDFTKVFSNVFLVVQYFGSIEDFLKLRGINRNFREIIDYYVPNIWSRFTTIKIINKAFNIGNAYVVRQIKLTLIYYSKGKEKIYAIIGNDPFDKFFITNHHLNIDEMALSEGFISLKKQYYNKTTLNVRIEMPMDSKYLTRIRNILELGVDPNERNEIDGKNAIETVLSKYEEKSFEVFSLLNEYGAIIDDNSFSNLIEKTVVHCTMHFREYDKKRIEDTKKFVRNLLEMGGNLRILNEYGESVIILLSKVVFLLKVAIDFINQGEYDKSSLFNQKDGDGNSIIMTVGKYYVFDGWDSVFHDRKTALRLLIENGADPYEENYKGENAFKYMSEKEYNDFLENAS